MEQHRPDEPSSSSPGDGPTPEQLAAFLDGELAAPARRAVEDWLAVHPEEQAEVEAMRRLDHLWHEAAPPEPTEEAWAGVLAHISDAATAVPQPRRRRAGAVWITLAATATAATLLLSFGLPRPPAPTAESTTQGASAPLAFLTADEVDIISINAADVDALIVGEPPHRGAIVMASADDVIVHESGGNVEVVMPDQKDQGSPAWPLVLVSSSSEPKPPEPGRQP